MSKVKFVVRLSVVLHIMGRILSVFFFLSTLHIARALQLFMAFLYLGTILFIWSYIPLAMAFATNEYIVYSGCVSLGSTMVASGRLESSQRAHEY